MRKCFWHCMYVTEADVAHCQPIVCWGCGSSRSGCAGAFCVA
jgi:hypothetical protein